MNERPADSLSPSYYQQEICAYLHLLDVASTHCKEATRKIDGAVTKALESYARIPQQWRAYVCEPRAALAAASQEMAASVRGKQSEG